MKKLTREMLIIEPKECEQKCKTCPFMQKTQTCLIDEINHELFEQINSDINNGLLFCETHSITIKP